MALASFDGLPLAVATEDGRVPGVQVNADKTETWTVELLVTRATSNALEQRVSSVTALAAIGTRGGNLVIDSGVGAKALTIPIEGDLFRTWSAVLTDYSSTPDLARSTHVRGRATFLLANEL